MSIQSQNRPPSFLAQLAEGAVERVVKDLPDMPPAFYFSLTVLGVVSIVAVAYSKH